MKQVLKKLLRIIGIIMMVLNGMCVAAFVIAAVSLIKDIGIGVYLACLAVYAGLCWLGYRLYLFGADKSSKKSGKTQQDTGAVRTQPVTDQTFSQTAENVPASAKVPSFQRQMQTERQADLPVSGSAKAAGTEHPEYWTVLASYLALPFHDGDHFFLFEGEEAARGFVRVSGRSDLSVHKLNKNTASMEVMEYLCCGYTGAVLKKSTSAITICRDDIRLNAEELALKFELPQIRKAGNILPASGKVMHKYLNQLSYTWRKYSSPEAVPQFWQDHLKQFKDEVIRSLLCANLCLPAKQEEGQPLSFSVLSAVMPSGEKWAVVFTDTFAITRYMGAPQKSIVFPKLLHDVAGNIRKGEITDVQGIMINPGREEFKVTVQEIEEQEDWLKNHPESQKAYIMAERKAVQALEQIMSGEPASGTVKETSSPDTVKEAFSSGAIKEASSSGAAEAVSSSVPADAGSSFVTAAKNAPDAGKTEQEEQDAFSKIDLNEGERPEPVSSGCSFFTGLLPGEVPYSDRAVSDPGADQLNAERFVHLTTVGSAEVFYEFCFYYDPAYRRFVKDSYLHKNGDRQYLGRSTMYPLELIDQFHQYPEDRSPVKMEKIHRIQKIMTEETGFGE